MKILLVSKIYPSLDDPDYGVFVANFEQAIHAKGGIVYRSVIQGRVHGNFDKLYRYLIFFLSVYKNLLTKDFDLIYVHFANHSLLPLIPVYRFIRKPIVINAHGGDIVPAERKRAGIISKVTKNIINQSALIVVPSNYYKEITETLYKNKVIFVSPSGGVDLAVFKPIETNADNTQGLRVGYVSRIDYGKGWDVFLKALNLLKNHSSALKLKADIVGYGLDIDRFQSMVDSMGLCREVKYFGVKKQYELANVYASLDLFVFPTTRHEETLGLVGIEAMACGVPVIGSRIGGLVEYIRDGENGYLFTPGNHKELAEKILIYNALDSEQKMRMRDCALLTAKQYSKDLVVDALYSELTQLMIRTTSEVMSN